MQGETQSSYLRKESRALDDSSDAGVNKKNAKLHTNKSEVSKTSFGNYFLVFGTISSSTLQYILCSHSHHHLLQSILLLTMHT